MNIFQRSHVKKRLGENKNDNETIQNIGANIHFAPKKLDAFNTK